MSKALSLWVSIRGTGSPTVVFEAGGGEDSSVWTELEAEVRNRYAVRTMLYDRAGLLLSTYGFVKTDDRAAIAQEVSAAASDRQTWQPFPVTAAR